MGTPAHVVSSRLLVDLRRVTGLPPYADEGVRDVIADINALHRGMTERLSEPPAKDEEAAAQHACPVVQNCTLRRHKRCLVVYHSVRCERVEAIRWNVGAVIPAAARGAMCRSEVDYFKAYSALVLQYLEDVQADLTLHEKPPRCDRIYVKALQDCGTLQTVSGPRQVSKGETHLMARADCEAFVRRGMLVQVALE